MEEWKIFRPKLKLALQDIDFVNSTLTDSLVTSDS